MKIVNVIKIDQSSCKIEGFPLSLPNVTLLLWKYPGVLTVPLSLTDGVVREFRRRVALEIFEGAAFVLVLQIKNDKNVNH